MDLSHKTLSLLLFLCMCADVAGAQINPVYQAIHKNRKSLAGHPIPQLIRLPSVDYLGLMGHDSTAIANLVKVGYVDVDTFLRNDYNLTQKIIPVMIHSGPQVDQIGEIRLHAGEHVLLFLSAWSVIANAEYNASSDYYKNLIRDTTIRFEIVGFDGKYLMSSDNLW